MREDYASRGPRDHISKLAGGSRKSSSCSNEAPADRQYPLPVRSAENCIRTNDSDTTYMVTSSHTGTTRAYQWSFAFPSGVRVLNKPRSRTWRTISSTLLRISRSSSGSSVVPFLPTKRQQTPLRRWSVDVPIIAQLRVLGIRSMSQSTSQPQYKLRDASQIRYREYELELLPSPPRFKLSANSLLGSG